MSDKLVVEIDSKDAEVAMRNLDRLTTAAEQMGKAFENTKGATSALRELRLMLTGIKGQGSSLDELKNSIQSLNSTADSLKRSFAGSVGQLGRIFKNEMAELKSIVQETGLGVGRAAAKGIEEGIGGAAVAVKKAAKEVNDTLGIEFVQGIRNAAKTATAEAAKLGLAFSEIARSAEAGKTRAATAMKALEADLLKDELAYQAQIQTARKGLQADLLKDELAYQAQIRTARKGMQADLLKDELAYQAQQKTLKDGLQSDLLKDELAYQAQIQTARKGMQADLLKDELAYQAQQKTLKDGLQADTLKDELAYQTQIQAARKGMQADLLKDELAYQAQIQTARKGLQADLLKDELAYQTQQKALKDGLQADLLKDELAYQAQQKTVKDGLQADLLKDELTYQAQIQTARKGMQADLLKDELAYQAQVQTARKGMQADLLKDELAYQAQQKTLKDGLQADMLKDELAYQAQIQTARKGLQADMLKDELAYQAQQKTLKDGLHADMLKDELAYQAQQKKMQEAYEADKLKDLMFAQARYEKELKEGAKRQLEIDRHRVAAAMNSPSGDYQRYDPSSGLKGSVVKLADSKKVDALSASFRKLTIDGNNVHSMARGLASGFNLLWLTWGNLVPLFAGAAISNGFMQTIKLGTQVGHTFQTIASLGEVSAEGVAMLRTQLYEIGQSGPYGPEQVAEAMKTLALAGLQLNEILAVTPTVLNFALAGTTSITQAADVLVSVTSAFGTGAAGFEESADIITRSAADSKASVESFGEAMKTASVVGELYGAAQRDVALMIQYLSQVGIQGTSAGTAVRNAMADISGRSGQAQRILKSLGAEFKQSTGEVIPFIDQMRELNRITKDYDAVSQKNIINAIYGERGSKVAAVGLQAFNTAAKDASKYSNKLEEDLARLEDAAGDSAIASAQMAQSTQKAFEAVAATAKTVLVEAFDTIEPQMYLVADALRKAFASDEAKEGLRTLVTAVADLAMVVAKNLTTIVEYGLAWAAFKVAVFGANAIVTTATSLLGLYTNSKIKDTAATIAQAAAEEALTKAIGANKAAAVSAGAAALSMGTKLLGALPIVGNAILLGSLAWDLYKSSVDGAGKTVDNYVDTKADNIITALENETSHIREVNELRAQGLTLMEAEARVKFSNSKSEMLSASEAKIQTAEAEIRRLRTVNASYSNPTDVSYGLLERKQNTAKILQLEAEISEARSEQGTNSLRMVLAENERREAAQETLRLTRLEQEAAKKSTVTGTKTWSLDEFQGGGKGFGGPREFYEAQKTAFDKSIQEIEKRGKVEIEKLQSIAADKKAILDSEQQAGLLSTEEYNSQLMVLLKSSEDAQIAEIRKTSQDFRAEYDKRHRTISDLIAKAEATSAKGKGASAAKAANLKELRAELSTLEELGVTSSERWASAIDKLTSRYDKDLQVSINKNLGSLKKLREEDDKFWKDQTDELAKAKALDAVNQQYANINDSVFSLDEASKAYALAFADSASKSEAYIGKLSTELETAQYAAEEFWHAVMADGEFSDTDSSGYISYLKNIQGLEKLIIDARAKGATLADDAGNLAFDRKRKEQNTKLANDLSDAVMTGLLDGAEAGKKKLRDVLVAELRKPIKMVVDLVVNTVVGGIMGGIGGAAQAGQGGAGGANTVQTGFSALNSSISSTIGNAFSKFAGSSVGQGLGLSNTTYAAGPMGPVAPGTELTATGQQMSQALGVVGDTLAGYAMGSMARSLISNGYSAGKGMDTFQKVGTAVGSAIGGPVAGAIIGAGAGVFNQLFGRKLKDSGIQGTFGGTAGFEGEKYEFYKGGVFRSNKTKTSPLDQATTDGLTQQFRAIQLSTGLMAETLGLASGAVASFTKDIKLSFKGLTEEQIQEKMAAEFAAISDEMAQQVLGTQQTEYAKASETASQTLTRLSTSLITVSSAFELLGVAMLDASLASGDMASRLIEQSGGGEAFAANLGTYYDNFYSEAEKTANVTRSVSDALAAVGLAMPATRDDFRALVESQIALGDSGTQAVAALLGVSGAFASVTDAAETAAAAAARVAKAEGADRKDRLAAQRELEKQAAEALQKQIEAYADGAEQFNTLRDSLLKAGDAAGLLAAVTERAFADPSGKYMNGRYDLPRWESTDTAASFNYRYGEMQARMRQQLGDEASANALRIENVKGVLGAYSVEQMMSEYDSVTGPIKLAIQQGIVDASGDLSYAVRDAVQGAALYVAMADVRGQFTSNGPGLASIAAARASAADAGRSSYDYSTGLYRIGGASVEYGKALDNLKGSFGSGAITADVFERSVVALNEAMPGAAESVGTLEDLVSAMQSASYMVGNAGLSSIRYYFGSLSELTAEFAQAAAEAQEPIAQTTAAIGRLNSAQYAFAESATATLQGFGGGGVGGAWMLQDAGVMKDINRAQLIAEAAGIASAAMTTADAAAAAAKLAQSPAFAELGAKGIRDASLLLDGVGEYNADGFERAFIRISDALAKGSVTEDQYKALFDTALDMFEGVPEETRTLIDSMTRLRDAMSGFADGLLIDEQRTTLSASATLAEMQRQYTQAFAGAATGDSESISKYQQLANTLLDKELYRTQAEYNAAFGSVYGDARQLEAIGINTAANAQGDEMVAELKDMNAKLNKRVEDLEKNLMAALAQIAKNTSDTSRGIEQQIVMAEDTP